MKKQIALCLALLVAPLGNLFAANMYPSHPIRLIVPFPPGGAPDVVARLMADDMAKSLGQPIIVENKPGASANIGMSYVAKSKPDGYTIILSSASLAINKSMIKNTPFDPVDDFTPISLIAMVPSVMVVPANIPADSVQSFIDYARTHQGKLNYGTSGVGTTQHLAGVMFNKIANTDIVHIPHKGQNALVPELIAGRVQLSFNNISAVQPFVESKELKILAIALPERWSEFPDIPTFSQAGLPGFEVSSWLALFGPANLPKPILQKIYQAAKTAMDNPAIRDRVVSAGNYPVVSTPDDLKAFLDEEIGRWSKAVEQLENR
ncbi:tripartite tricarboxylate transporter substrate binding protein [Pollutimonas sp. H1-120]|uniref:tripartite tricarboxylate transporter substrate binding protein n=1 Tax=Pollutimonas sp. H1-120 TaxID=3148824 RepID=UPI003B52FD47